MRVALGIEYRGSAYLGWERQKHGPTVQQALETALHRVADAEVRTVCAGRTDTGVHGYGQVVHLDAPARRPPEAWIRGTNSHLPGDIAVRWVRFPGAGFHARFLAASRTYRYVIFNDANRPAIGSDLVTWEYRPLDAGRMNTAAAALLGTHDFDAFRSSQCQARSPVRTITSIEISRRDKLILLDVSANGFLHHMVRNIVGSLLEVGSGRRSAAWFEEVLKGRDRRDAGATAKPQGLYLVNVTYPANFDIPSTLPSTPALW